jgi:hypothetical protein
MAWSRCSLNVPPSLWLIVRSFVRSQLSVLLPHVPLRCQTADDAYSSTSDDQTAGILVARLLGAELQSSVRLCHRDLLNGDSRRSKG